VQTSLPLPRSSFPQLSLRGDKIFTYDINKQLDLEDLDYEEKEKAKTRKKEEGIIQGIFVFILSLSKITQSILTNSRNLQ
jgi:hypothetical protein